MNYIFVLGSTQLTQAELTTVLQRIEPLSQIEFLDDVAIVNTDSELNSSQLIKLLGGTIKIAKITASISEITPDSIAQILFKQAPHAQVFGISVYNSSTNFNLNLPEIKQILSEKGMRTRYIEAKEGNSLSSVVVVKQKVTEVIMVFDTTKKLWWVGITQAVQDFEDWGSRDFGRPAADARSGMLPPKVARILVNLAFPEAYSGEQLTLLDPFCGVGTILAEAMLLGWKVIGIDQSENAVANTRKNLSWLTQKYPETADRKYMLHVGDATHAHQLLGQEKIDAIATEPFLGSPFIKKGTDIWQKDQPVTTARIKNVVKGLEKLYIGVLREWQPLLKTGSKVVITLPEFAIGGKTFFVKKVVDMCENLGYTLSQGPYTYARPQAIVKRNIYVLQKS